MELNDPTLLKAENEMRDLMAYTTRYHPSPWSRAERLALAKTAIRVVLVMLVALAVIGGALLLIGAIRLAAAVVR